jgi:hypothetical protein
MENLITIQVVVDDDISFDHAQKSVMDALSFADNVTQAEHDLIQDILNKLQEKVRQTKTN